MNIPRSHCVPHHDRRLWSPLRLYLRKRFRLWLSDLARWIPEQDHLHQEELLSPTKSKTDLLKGRFAVLDDEKIDFLFLAKFASLKCWKHVGKRIFSYIKYLWNYSPLKEPLAGSETGNFKLWMRFSENSIFRRAGRSTTWPNEPIHIYLRENKRIFNFRGLMEAILIKNWIRNLKKLGGNIDFFSNSYHFVIEVFLKKAKTIRPPKFSIL